MLKDLIKEVINKLSLQRHHCLAEASRYIDVEGDQESHYRGQALALRDAIRLLDEALAKNKDESNA